MKDLLLSLLRALTKKKYHEALKFKYHHEYDLIDSYVFPDDIYSWEYCPVCIAKPKVWVFDNGRSTGCKCHNSEYDHFSIYAESIMSSFKKNGNLSKYKKDDLRLNWNHWYKTGRVKFKHASKRKDGRW